MILPIKLEPSPTNDVKFVEWMLHNTCNYDCKFCGSQYKDGSHRWLSLDLYKTYTDNIINACGGSPAWFQITGGEPTLYPDLLELLSYIKGKGIYTSLISNGSRTLRWWEELKNADVLDILFVTYHTNQLSEHSHIVEVLNLFHDKPVETICLITYDQETIDRAIEAKKNIIENTGATVLVKVMSSDKMIYKDDQFNQIGTIASNQQKKLSKKKSTVPVNHAMANNIKLTFDNDTIRHTTPQYLLKTNANSFFNWKCNAGIDNVRILVDKVYRGVCEEGGVQTTLDNFKFNTDHIICKKKSCVCHTDIVIKKER